MGFPRERTAPMASGSPESSSRLKVWIPSLCSLVRTLFPLSFGLFLAHPRNNILLNLQMVPKEDPREKQRRSSDGAVFGTQPPPRLNSTSVIIHQPLAGRADPAGSKWEQSMPLNSGAMMHYTSCYGQNIMQRDKLSSCTYKDATTSIPLISQAAADEGSRTGTKSGRVLNAINSGVVSGERKSAGALHCIDKTMASPRITESDPSNTLRRVRYILFWKLISVQKTVMKYQAWSNSWHDVSIFPFSAAAPYPPLIGKWPYFMLDKHMFLTTFPQIRSVYTFLFLIIFVIRL